MIPAKLFIPSKMAGAVFLAFGPDGKPTGHGLEIKVAEEGEECTYEEFMSRRDPAVDETTMTEWWRMLAKSIEEHYNGKD